MSRRLAALALTLGLFAGELLAGGSSRCGCCTTPRRHACCAAMAGASGGSCAMHGGSSCSLRQSTGGLAVLHVHEELQPRTATEAAPPAAALQTGLAARLPEGAFPLPSSLSRGPETPPPRLLQVA